MNNLKKYIFLLVACTFISCNVKYNFTGTGKIDAKTFQVNYFQNMADIVEPGIERTFTQKLQNTILNQTNLNLVASGGDLLYEGEIVEYRITPMAATSNQVAAQNRMTITINVRYSNKNKEDDNFEKRFSFYYDYAADVLPQAVLGTALDEIYERITQDIFNQSLAKW
ncbi:Probable lipoprotein precursor [Flavobacterium indicum GPTSA100-9 = DSM 17447]|uniref:Probable lipoprotein n=1 Tax=Flavobacterium indicum (strain DSM 17447 / CIP 109464 / GPTSA100-9) TaxID=1094466 RepID=H8XPV6_FLAIG|nr:LptE family protein [Flavobacterium indicum]CCG54172.1 Probable lipoprotein precursor [Flavobacterium indicum GPTSA100-9 = DSM 17447]